ncbi:MAG: hypothetical protein ACTHOG_08525 [Marmoricola sp.]
MLAIAIPIVIVVIALVAAAAALRRLGRRQQARADDLRSDDRTLHYCVPNGFEPVEVVVALRRAGYEVVHDASVGQVGELLIGAPEGRRLDRERVRLLLAEVTNPKEARGRQHVSVVRFMDE